MTVRHCDMCHDRILRGEIYAMLTGCLYLCADNSTAVRRYVRDGGSGEQNICAGCIVRLKRAHLMPVPRLFVQQYFRRHLELWQDHARAQRRRKKRRAVAKPKRMRAIRLPDFMEPS